MHIPFPYKHIPIKYMHIPKILHTHTLPTGYLRGPSNISGGSSIVTPGSSSGVIVGEQ